MPKFAGSLIGGMENATNENYKVGVVLIDEQSSGGSKVYPETSYQQKIIVHAKEKKYPIWVVELNPKRGEKANLPTHSALRDMLPEGTPVVTKTKLNAFESTDLHDLLQAAKITAFAVMGYNTNCCVRMTVTGTTASNSDVVTAKGGIALGYLVLSCQEVLRGGEATWFDEPGVRFFEKAS